MGMFDSLIARCPFCKGDVEFQTKAGPCVMDIYRIDDAPPWILMEISGDVSSCSECNRELSIKVEYEFKVLKTEVTPVNNLDTMDLKAKELGMWNEPPES